VRPLKTSTAKRAEVKLREVKDALEDAVLAAARNRDREPEGKRRAHKAVGK
jgi:hypothetical protein